MSVRVVDACCVVCFVCRVGKFDIKVSAPKLGIELLVSEHATTTLKGKKVGLIHAVAYHELLCVNAFVRSFDVLVLAIVWRHTACFVLSAGWQEHSHCGRTDTGS